MKTNFKIFNLIIFNLIIFNLVNLQSTNAQMFWNQAGSFAGNSSSYAAVPNSSTINLTGGFTLEAWVNPVVLGGNPKGIISKGAFGTSIKYGMRLNSSGRIEVITNGIIRLVSRSFSALQVNKWTYVAVTYLSSFGDFKIYINEFLDTSATIALATPASNTDSLFIGISSSTTPFNGRLDEVRIWNRPLIANELNQFKNTSLGVSSGIYSGLVMSMTFQDDESSGTDFSLADLSGNGNNGINRGVTAVDLSDRPSDRLTQNECILLDGTNDYLCADDTSTIDPTTAVTLECWVYPTAQTICKFISKGTINATETRYALTMGFVISAIINGTTIIGSGTPTLNKWNHLAFTYSAVNGAYKFYKDGVLINSGTNHLGNIGIGAPDSLYIGGDQNNAVTGFMDEVRISNYAKSQNEIVKHLYQSIDLSNNSNPNVQRNICYNFDGTTIDNGGHGGPQLFLRGNTKFNHPSFLAFPVVSPINRADELNFPNGFYMKTANKRIPASGSQGDNTDSIFVNLNETISDINLFVGINHTNLAVIEIVLTAPNGDSVRVIDNNTIIGDNNNLITVFDDQADSSLISNRYISLSNIIKPVNNMNPIFSGDNSLGKWKIRVVDVANADTGFLYTWGININNKSMRERNLNVSALMQGFYFPLSSSTVQDTMKVYLRTSNSPFNIIDSSSAFLNNVGDGLFSFDGTKVVDGIQYYIQLKHRNSIETWSKTTQSFISSSLSYDFRSAANKAFGDNMLQIDNLPLRFAIYSGDVNQDGVVDATDLGAIDNDASNFVTGYVQTDITGDEVVDASDASVVDNNAFNFVSKITP